MNFIDKILYYLSVPKCICCTEKLDIDDRALCKKCFSEYKRAKTHICPACAKQIYTCSCTNKYLESHFVNKLVRLFQYTPSSGPNERIPQNQLIYILKRNKRKDLIDLLADELSESLKMTVKAEDYVITNVPRNNKRVLQYGFDHAQELAKKISEKLKIPYVDLLVSKHNVAQKKLHGEMRLENAKYDYKRKSASISGKRIILIDDIVTTGASMGSCAMLIKGLGAKQIVGAAIAVTFRANIKPFAKTVH